MSGGGATTPAVPSVTELTPGQRAAWEKEANEDWREWEKESAAAVARGEDPVAAAMAGKKYTFLPKEESVPPGRESKGVPPEQQNPYSHELTPEEKTAWEEGANQDAREWIRRWNVPQRSSPPPQNTVETRVIRGGETAGVPQPVNDSADPGQSQPQAASPTPARALPETQTRIAKPVAPDANSSKVAADPMKLPGRGGAAFGPRKVILEKYGPAVEQARADAGGPGGSCEKAKLFLLDKLEGTGARGVSERVGRGANAFDHEVVITRDAHVLDPVARQAIDRGLTTEAELEQASLLKAVNDGVFTQQQWEAFKLLGGPRGS
jgi:hypothetical protein